LSDKRSLDDICRAARTSVVEMTHKAQSAHVGSSLSVIEVLVSAYVYSASISETSSVFLSKGHAAAALYAVLAELGYIPKTELSTYCSDGSLLSGHASHFGIPGVPISTGSLGHALPVATGVAYIDKLQGCKDQTVVVLSDGECDEGSNWEAALFAGHHRLSNLKVVIDRNGLQSIAETENTLGLEPLADKWRAFGWFVEVCPGHDVALLLEMLGKSNMGSASPTVIIAETTKGKGVSFMENNNLWHYRSPGVTDLEAALTEIQRGHPG